MAAEPAVDPAAEHSAAGQLTVDELAAAAGIPVRRIRFYAGRRLLPPPRLEGRVGWYGPQHLARLRVVQQLQEQGFTLSAIEEALEPLPDDADAATVELAATVLAPTSSGEELSLTPAELEERVGQPLDRDRLAVLEQARLLRCDGELVHLNEAQLDFATRLLRLDAPLDALVEAGAVVQHHVTALAAELQQLFRTRIAGPMLTGDGGDETERERLRELAAALRPLTIRALVVGYQEALEREVRRSRG